MIAVFFRRLLLFFCCGSLSLLLTDNFRVEKIVSFTTISPCETPLDPHVRSLLSQPFHYLAKGSQSYIFASADGHYVLKLFKDPRKQLHSWTWLGSNLLKKGLRWLFKTLHSDKRSQKWHRHLCSLRLASDHLRQETGIIYAHLDSITHFNLSLVITDKIHIAHTLSLDAVPFVIQKRATPLKEHLNTLKTAGRAEEAHKCLEAIAQLMQTVKEKGLLYTDAKMDNLGVVEGSPLLIDIGCIHRPALQNAKLWSRYCKFAKI